ncbi:hypothetical protein [Streptomyces sp. NPDC056227]|uniref:hypothetical protein n=1 Tax=Streptomyces sp. NPDC056227 TaxID=3345753 RepID=UPI0035D9A85F
MSLHATTWQAAVLAAVQKTPPLLFSLRPGAWCDRVRKRPLMMATGLVCRGKQCSRLVDQLPGRAITGAHLVALVRSGAKFENGVLVEREETAAAT